MVIQCPSCKRQYNVDADRITESGVKITCPSCKHQFIARRGKQPEEKPAKKPEKKGPKTPPCAVCGQPSTHVLRGPPPRPLCEHHFQNEKEKESRFWEAEEGFAPPGVEKDPGSSAWNEPGETRANVPAAGKTQPGPPSKFSAPTAKPGKPIVRPPDADPAFETFDDDFDFFEEGPGGTSGKKTAPGAAGLKPAPASPPQSIDMNFDFDDAAFPRPGEKTAPGPAGQKPAPAPSAAGLKPATTSPAARVKPAPAPSAAGLKPASSADDFGFDGLEFGPPAAGEENPFKPPPAKPQAVPSKPGPRPSSPPDDDPFAAGAMDLGLGSESDQAGEDNFSSKFKGGATNLDGTPAEERSDQDEGEASFEWNVGGRAPSEPGSEDKDLDLKLARETVAPPAPAKKIDFELKRPKPAKARGPAAAITIIAGLFLVLLACAFLSAQGQPQSRDNPTPPAPAAWLGRLEPVPSDVPERLNLSVPEFAQANGEEQARDQAEAEDHARRARLLMFQDTRASYDAALREIQAAVSVDPKNLDYPALKISIVAFRESMDDKGETMVRGAETEQAWNSLRPALQSDPALARAKAHLLLNTNKNIAAQTILEEYIAKNSSDPVAYFILGQTYRYQNPPDPAKALMYLETAIRLEPAFIRAYWEAARVDRDLNRPPEAIAKYKEILKRSPERKGVPEAMELSTGKAGPKPEVPPSTAPGKTPEPGPGTAPPVAAGPKPEAPKGRGIAGTGSQAADDIVESINDASRLFLKNNTGRNASEPPPKARPPEEGPPPPPEEGPK